MVEINRVWLNVDTDTNKITLFSRPRVSIRVDECMRNNSTLGTRAKFMCIPGMADRKRTL